MLQLVRKKNPLIFDLLLFIGFSLAAFAAYLLTETLASTGAIISVLALSLICLALMLSR